MDAANAERYNTYFDEHLKTSSGFPDRSILRDKYNLLPPKFMLEVAGRTDNADSCGYLQFVGQSP
jgi:hypothetical protein